MKKTQELKLQDKIAEFELFIWKRGFWFYEWFYCSPTQHFDTECSIVKPFEGKLTCKEKIAKFFGWRPMGTFIGQFDGKNKRFLIEGESNIELAQEIVDRFNEIFGRNYEVQLDSYKERREFIATGPTDGWCF